jgi:hypothetical protein
MDTEYIIGQLVLGAFEQGMGNDLKTPKKILIQVPRIANRTCFTISYKVGGFW